MNKTYEQLTIDWSLLFETRVLNQYGQNASLIIDSQTYIDPLRSLYSNICLSSNMTDSGAFTDPAMVLMRENIIIHREAGVEAYTPLM